MIHHVLADGTVVPDITGMIIKADDFPVIYEVLQKEGDAHEPVSTSN